MASEILNIVLHITAFGALLCAGLLFLRRGFGDRSRKILAWCLSISGLMLLVRALGEIWGLFPLARAVLPPTNLMGGLLVILLFLLYPIEVIRPGWLDFKRVLVVFAPWLLVRLLFACIPDFRPLASFGEIVQYGCEFNVWVRVLTLLLFVPITFILFKIPHNWTRSSADNRWIRWYSCGACGITLLYALFMLTGAAAASIVHMAYCMGFFLVITYQEVFIRIAVPAEKPDMPSADMLSRVLQPERTKADPLWEKLNHLMDDEQPWRNPDLTLEMLAVRLGSNRTKLTKLIHRQGFEDYRHFINRRRIAEFLKIVEANPRVNIQETLFVVGFRSKMTALRYFRQYTGTTPTGYLRNGSEME